MDYYKQLYDINFFSCDKYKCKVGESEVTIISPGFPDWETWRSQYLIKEKARKICNDFKSNSGKFCESLLIKEKLKDDDFLLLTLILCEDAYRNCSKHSFFFLNRMLYSSNSSILKLKATKLHYAWLSLFTLIKSSFPLMDIINHSLDYLNNKVKDFNFDQIKVETPVKKDWESRGISLSNKNDLINFYKTTFAYIIELMAANHQVETLFNYYVILDTLMRLGVTRIYDYGSGVGTFLILAQNFNIDGIYSDLKSETMNYAKTRIKDLNIDIPFISIDPDKLNIPENLDCIVCTEVLEHINNPELLVKKIYNSLHPKGIFVVSESFNYMRNFCTHLPEHYGKGGKIFYKFLEELGFKKIEIGYNIHPSLHIKF